MARFLIDTDTASDDAIAIVMALRHPEITVEALTVVCGNVGLDQAVQNALYTVELCDADVPVYAGAPDPLMRHLETAQYVHGEDGMGDCGLPLSGRTPAPERGADVIVDTILNNPGEITVVALGPLTNLAIAVARAPEIVDAVDRVVVMGGTGIGGPGNVTAMAEFNFWADAEAAHIVTRSGLPLEFVGWDVSVATSQITDARYEALTAIDTKYSKFAIDISETVRQFVRNMGIEGNDLPDPVAMAHAIDPSAAQMSFLPVDVMSGDGPQRGVMSVDQLGFGEAPANVNVLTAYDSDRFFTMLHELLAT